MHHEDDQSRHERPEVTAAGSLVRPSTTPRVPARRRFPERTARRAVGFSGGHALPDELERVAIRRPLLVLEEETEADGDSGHNGHPDPYRADRDQGDSGDHAGEAGRDEPPRTHPHGLIVVPAAISNMPKVRKKTVKRGTGPFAASKLCACRRNGRPRNRCSRPCRRLSVRAKLRRSTSGAAPGVGKTLCDAAGSARVAPQRR